MVQAPGKAVPVAARATGAKLRGRIVTSARQYENPNPAPGGRPANGRGGRAE